MQESVWEFYYDEFGNLGEAQLPANGTGQRLEYRYDYDPVVNTYPVTVSITSLGFTSTAEYGYLYGKPTKTTDVNGNEMWYAYDALGRIVRITAPYEQGNQNPYTIKMEYHPHNYADPDIGHNWSNPYSYAITRHYDPGRPGDDIITTVVSDGWGRMLQTKKDAEIGGQEVSLVTGKVEYDCFGRTLKQFYPFTETAYDAARPLYNPQVVTGTETVTTYDIMDRPTSVRDPMNHVTQMSYGFGSDNGRRYFRTTTVDAKNNAVTVLKDGLGLQVLTAAPMNTVTRFEYDAIGQLRKSIDPDGLETLYWHDMLGQLIRRQHPDAGTDTYEYDPAGNVVMHENAAGERMDYTYHYNLLTDIEFSHYPENNVHHGYGTAADTAVNAVGKVVFQEDGSGWQTFKYGKLGEVTENIRTFAVPFDNQTYTFKMNFEYDSWNRIRTMTYPDGEVVSYAYNRGGLLDSVSGDKGAEHFVYLTHIDYNPFELKDAVYHGNGAVSEFIYDELLRLKLLLSECADGTMQKIEYNYDEVGNIIAIDNGAGILPNGLGGSYSERYSYDNLYRLATDSGLWHGNLPREFMVGMSYYPNGRISKKNVEIQDIATGYSLMQSSNYYQYPDSSNKLASIGHDSQQDFEWDMKGNLAYQTDYHFPLKRRFCWDEQNRLLGVRDEDGLQHFSYYQYDANGDRTLKFTGLLTSQNLSGEWYSYYYLDSPTLYASPYLVATPQGYTKHYYAGSERIASRVGGGGLQDLGMYTNRNSETRISHQELSSHLLGSVALCLETTVQPAGNALSDLYYWEGFKEEEQNCYWYHPDHLGSSSWITYTDGSAVQHLYYLPWGEDLVDQRTTNWSARFTFSAKERDPETGLSYFGSRYYSSDLSIWLSVDPMSDKYASLSPYVYCADNPVKLVDPNGEEIWEPDKQALANNREIRFIAQKGDDLHTLAIQTGLDYEYLNSLYGGTTFNEGVSYSFDKIPSISKMNEFLNNGMDCGDYNCRAFALYVNGISNAEFSASPSPITDCFQNLSSLSQAQTGDVISMADSYEDFYNRYWTSGENPYINSENDFRAYYTNNISTRISHYGVVLLKSPDGNTISWTIEKRGRTPVDISPFPSSQKMNFNGQYYQPYNPTPIQPDHSSYIYRHK